MDSQMMAAAAGGLAEAHKALGNIEKARHYADSMQELARRMGIR
jgi:hypothetical protein